MRFTSLRAPLFAAAVLAGCTPVQWQDPVTGALPSAGEQDYCSSSAFHEARRQAFFASMMRRPYFDRFGRFRHDPWSRFGYADQWSLEQDLYSYCMRARGYRLVPVRPADR